MLKYELAADGKSYRLGRQDPSLTEARIPPLHQGLPVTEVGEDAFRDCKSLVYVLLPNSVTCIGEDAFWGCTGLIYLDTGDGVKSVGDYAFFGCTSLAAVRLGNAVESLGTQAFYRCTSLVAVVFPRSIKQLGSSLFGDCKRMHRIYSGDTQIPDHWGTAWRQDAVFTVISQGEWHFVKNKDACTCSVAPLPDTVGGTIPATYKKRPVVGAADPDPSALFYPNAPFMQREKPEEYGELTALSRIPSPPSEEFCTPDCVTLWESQVLSRVSAWNTVAEMPLSAPITAFAGTDVEQISFPRADPVMEALPTGMFARMHKLVSLVLPAGIRRVDRNAFFGCTALPALTFPDGVKEIGREACRDCISLRAVLLPASLERIEEGAFFGCSLLQTVIYGGTKREWSKMAREPWWIYSSRRRGITVYCTDGALVLNGCEHSRPAYEPSHLCFTAAEGGKAYALGRQNRMLAACLIPDTHEGLPVTEITAEAFCDCVALNDLHCSAGITRIGTRAFFRCPCLRGLVFAGTMAQWKSIAKGESLFSRSVTVFCNDGEINIKV